MTQAPLTPHRVIAGRVKKLRRDRGWSAAHLASELVRVGVQWDRSIVANFENGRRATVSVEEMFALAYVLSVAPVHLLVPVDAEETDPYQVLPEGNPAGAWFVRAWIRGQAPLGDPRLFFAEAPADDWVPPDWQWTPENIAAAGLARDRQQSRGDDGQRQ